MTNNEICRGCLTYSMEVYEQIGYPRCWRIPSKDGEVCPCSMCIVKTMCREKCENLKRYIHLARNIKSHHI